MTKREILRSALTSSLATMEPAKHDFKPYTCWTQRGQAWEKATRYRHKVADADHADMWDDVVTLAEATGFWLEWMAVFHDHAEVRKRLIAEFTGTRTWCFDSDINVVADLTI